MKNPIINHDMLEIMDAYAKAIATYFHNNFDACADAGYTYVELLLDETNKHVKRQAQDYLYQYQEEDAGT